MNEQTNRLLNDIRAYLRISAAAASKVSAPKILDTYEKALVYRMLDGKTSQYKVEETTGVPQPTISRWLEAFVQARLVTPPDEYNQSHRALFTLEELGIELAMLKKRAKKGAKPSQETTPTTTQTSTSEAQQGSIQKYLEEEKGEPTK